MGLKQVSIKRVQGNVYDAFWEEGWLHWTRFLWKKGEVTYLKGKTIASADKEQLTDLMRKANGS